MKTIFVSSVLLLLGLAVGWHSGHKYAKRETTDVVRQMVENIESADTAETARAARAIGLIDSGETEAAVHLLATPIVKYYLNYGERVAGNDVRLRLRLLIEDLIKTNAIVANEIANRSPSK
jgi:hypothetical protein